MTLLKKPLNRISRSLIKYMMRSMISLFLTVGLSALFNSGSIHAQQNDRMIAPLNEADYVCWQQLNCVIKNEGLREKGWIVSFDETIKNYPQPRTAQLTGENLSVIAHYDKDGNLISGKYELTNVALPRVLLTHLADKDYSGWTMKANQIIVHDFNAVSTEYHVVLENEKDSRKLVFSYSDILDMKSENAEVFAENQK